MKFLQRLAREPLLHFLVLGAVIFLVYGQQNDGFTDADKRIVISSAEIEQLALLWHKRQRRPPTADELDALIEQRIHEEVLYREALAMGLDRNDSVLRRRLAQKVEFISSDLASLVEPTEEELAAFLAENSSDFETPARISFEHVYLNADRHGKQLQADAQTLLEKLQSRPPQTTTQPGTAPGGDAFMYGSKFEDISKAELGHLFGQAFSQQVFSLPLHQWQGPVRSGYGLHLVRVTGKTPAKPAALADVRERVRREWMDRQRRKINRNFYRGLRRSYEIIIEMPAATGGNRRAGE